MKFLLKFTAILILFTGNISKASPPDIIIGFNKSEITIQNLSKKWKLEKYKYSIFSEVPEEKEKNDYIHLKSDMTFASVSEGEYDEGQWELDTKNRCIILKKEGEEGVLPFIIEDLTDNKLILYIYDPSDDEAEDLKIHYKSE